MMDVVAEKTKELEDIRNTVMFVYASTDVAVEREAIMKSYVDFVEEHHNNQT